LIGTVARPRGLGARPLGSGAAMSSTAERWRALVAPLVLRAAREAGHKRLRALEVQVSTESRTLLDTEAKMQRICRHDWRVDREARDHKTRRYCARGCGAYQ